jgi:hypothetical protein
MTLHQSGQNRAATILARLDRLPGTRHMWQRPRRQLGKVWWRGQGAGPAETPMAAYVKTV